MIKDTFFHSIQGTWKCIQGEPILQVFLGPMDSRKMPLKKKNFSGLLAEEDKDWRKKMGHKDWEYVHWKYKILLWLWVDLTYSAINVSSF